MFPRNENARIAAAAPELLAACQAAKGRLAMMIAVEPSTELKRRMEATDDMLRAAITAATED